MSDREQRIGGLILGLLAVALVAQAGVYQWLGSNSTDWATAGNWQPSNPAASIVSGPPPSGGTFNHRLNVNNAGRSELIYDASLGATVFANTTNLGASFRGLVIGSGTLGSGRMTISGGSFSTVGCNAPDVLNNGDNATGTLVIAGGSYTSSAAGLNIGLGPGVRRIGLLTISSGNAVIPLLSNACTLATINLDGGELAVSSLTFRSTANCTNIVNLNGGTYRALGPEAGYGSTNARANVRDGGAIVDTAGFNITIGQALLHSSIAGDAATDGGLRKNGAGALTLTGTNTYTGPTLVNTGSLIVHGSIGAGDVTLAPGTKLGGGGLIAGSVTGGAGTVFAAGATSGVPGTLAIAGNLSLAGSDTVRVDVAGASSVDLIAVAGDVTPNGVTAIQIDGVLSGLTSGSYPILQASGALNGAVTNFSIPTSPTRVVSASLAYDTASSPKALLLNVVSSGQPSNLVWKGSGSLWDLGTSFNWLAGGLDERFFNDDLVTFDATGVAQTNIDLVGTVNPGAVTVDTSAGGYRFHTTGSGRIGGTNGLAKTGAGTLVIETANDYAGGTAIHAGTLLIGPGGAPGTGAITNDGTLVLARPDDLTLPSAISGTGVLVQQGSGTVTLVADNTYSGATLIETGTLRLGTGGLTGAIGSGPLTNHGTLAFNRADHLAPAFPIVGSGAVVKMATNNLTLAVNNDYTGPTYITNGAVVLAVTGGIGSGVSGGVEVSFNASLALTNGLAGLPAKTLHLRGPGVIGSGVFFPGSAVQRGALQSLAGSNEWAGPVTFDSVGGNTRIGVQDTAKLTIRGAITETTPGSSLYFRHGSTAGGDIILAGTGGQWTGETQIFGGGGAVRLGADNALSTSVLLRVGTTGIAGESALDLNGHNQTLAGLARVGAGNARVLNDGGALSVLTLNPTSYQAYYGAIADGAGQIQLVKAGTNTQAFSSNLTYSGSTTISGGAIELIMAGGFPASTDLVIGAGASLIVSGRTEPAFIISVTQQLRGAGTVRGNLVNEGLVAPGLSTGVLTVVGSYTQFTGTLQIELGGTAPGQHDALAVTGDAVLLGGLLDVSLVGGYTPAVGDAFTVVTGAQVVALFTATNLPALASPLFWTVSNEVSALIVTVGGPAGNIGVSGTLAFGDVTVGQTSNALLTITNAGDLAFAVTNILYPSGFSGAWTGTVDAGTASNVLVTFAPLAVQGYGGTIDVQSDARFGSGLIGCSGTGVTAAATGYELWAAAITNGLTGYQDDADGDGYPNLLEYALGGSPTNADTRARLEASRSAGTLSLVFSRNTNAIDTTIRVEGSFAATNGADWVGIATNSAGVWSPSQTETGAGSPVNVTVQDNVSGATNRFLRLRVTRP